MRFMMLVKANRKSEAGEFPSRELVEAMGKYNEEMVKAGVMLAGEGLHPTSSGARVTFSGGKPALTHGPFSGTDLIAGFWLIQVKSKQEAIDWAMRCPPPADGGEGEIELRRVFEASDFPEDVFPPELREREEQLREQIERKA